jgi:hypothetical protein
LLVKRVSLLVLLGLLPFSGCASPGAVRCRPVTGQITETMTGPDAAAGTVAGDLAGAISIQIDTIWAGDAGAQHFRARHTIVTAASDSLFTVDEGVMMPVAATIFRISNTLTASRGTGAFRDARGSLATEGHANFATGAVTLRYQGELCAPGARP